MFYSLWNVVFFAVCLNCGCGPLLAKASRRIVALGDSRLRQQPLRDVAKTLSTDVAEIQGFTKKPVSGFESLLQASAGKPPRGFAGKAKKDQDIKEALKHVGSMKCGETIRVNSASDKTETCPLECPYFAQQKNDNEHCTFVCVVAEDCTKMNPLATIADLERGICRTPMADACTEYNYDGTDTCAVCQSGYALTEDRICHFKYMMPIYIVAGIGLCVVLFLVFWVFDMGCRSNCNNDELERAMEFREKTKFKQQMSEGETTRTNFPLSTNILRDQSFAKVAGPGMMLHFQFQLNIILWALCVAMGWVCLATFIDNKLFVLGTRSFGTPRNNCILVAWGFETQQGLMWTKVLFLACVYTGTFVLCLLHSIKQLRNYQTIDFESDTMRDFAALVTGMPALPGSEQVEDDLKGQVDDWRKQNRLEKDGTDRVVGVSMCWDFLEQEEEVMAQIKDDVDDLDKDMPNTAGDRPSMNPIRDKLFNVESSLFAEGDDDESSEKPSTEDMLINMYSTSEGFIVFKTEGARDEAVEKSEDVPLIYKKGGVEYELKLKEVTCEPDTVCWVNFGHSSTGAKCGRLMIGFGCILLALTFWTVVFYMPYAWSIFSFNYDNGNQPGPIYGITFSMVVVIGNAIMYEVCARVADGVGFRFKDDREGCYMILYTIACTFNILMDFFTTYYMALFIMTGLGFRNYHGVKLADIDSFTLQFETYAMQRALAENTFAYAFPSTYLIPFLIEPIITVWVPLKMGIWIVSTHPEIFGRGAEEWLMMAPMEMGRYADICLDVLLGIMIFFFPGGYTHTLFFAMAGSHCFIYAFDHWRVLRAIPTCNFATDGVDWWSQAMMAPMIGLILSCLVFKGNCQDYGYCVKGVTLIASCCTAFWVHVIVHILILVNIVPAFGKTKPEDGGEGSTFADVAKNMPCSWFTANPVHCLRSKYLSDSKQLSPRKAQTSSIFTARGRPACGFCMTGKEKTMRRNVEIGCHYSENADDFKELASGSEKDLTPKKKRFGLF